MIYSLITGGSSGLGYEMAKKLIKLGKNVIIMGRDEKKLNNSIIKSFICHSVFGFEIFLS